MSLACRVFCTCAVVYSDSTYDHGWSDQVIKLYEVTILSISMYKNAHVQSNIDRHQMARLNKFTYNCWLIDFLTIYIYYWLLSGVQQQQVCEGKVGLPLRCVRICMWETLPPALYCATLSESFKK